MGYSSHAFDSLGLPFLIADERAFSVPANSEVFVTQDQFKLIFLLSGEVEQELDGIQGRVPFRKGDILICPTFTRHSYINSDPNADAQLHVMRLFLDGAYIRKHAQKRSKRPEHDITDYIYHHFRSTVLLQNGIDGEITECLNKLRRESEGAQIGVRHRARSLCTDLIITVSRKMNRDCSTVISTGAKKSNHLVASAKEYILKNLDSKLTLGEIAWKVGKGEEHLARVFKRETGQSVFDFIREMRINRAKTYLLSTSLSLTEIAELCGFASLSFFSRTFRAVAGINPSEYRQYIEATFPDKEPGMARLDSPWPQDTID